MSLERLVELTNIYEENEDLTPKTKLELSRLATMLEPDEIPVKNFSAKTSDGLVNTMFEGRDSVEGELLVTDRRILFTVDEEDVTQAFDIRYEEMDDCYVERNEYDATDGILIISADDAFCTFYGMFRFGLARWAEFINDKIDDTFK